MGTGMILMLMKNIVLTELSQTVQWLVRDDCGSAMVCQDKFNVVLSVTITIDTN